jgi:heat-inducible transcriptional repressor
MDLSERQRAILHRVVEEYVVTGQPVGSKSLVARGGITAAASTVRYELAQLETLGLLTHPHTSAGRVPTTQGYRLYAERVLDDAGPRTTPFPLRLAGERGEVEAALEATTEILSHLTRLLALVSAPPLEASVVRHVEVLLLQPQIVMVVVITSTGGVSKRVFAFEEPVDPGLAGWAHAYLNESLAGRELARHLLRRRLEDPGLGPREQEFLAVLAPAFTELLDGRDQRVFVGGAAGLLGEARGPEREACRRLLEVLEQRAALVRMLGRAFEPRRAFVRVGDLGHPDLQEFSLVGATYGLSNRPLGSVGLVGPVRMDYEKAIRVVRSAASELSSFLEEVYATD